MLLVYDHGCVVSPLSVHRDAARRLVLADETLRWLRPAHTNQTKPHTCYERIVQHHARQLTHPIHKSLPVRTLSFRIPARHKRAQLKAASLQTQQGPHEEKNQSHASTLLACSARLTAFAISTISLPMNSFPVPLNGTFVLTMLTNTPIFSFFWSIL